MLPTKRNYSLLNDIFNDPFFMNYETKVMRTDIKEEQNQYNIEIDLPGYTKENIKIELVDGYLNITAKIDSTNNNEDNYLRRERYIGESKRSFYVGKNIEEDSITASFRNGILNIIVPKQDLQTNNEHKYIEIND